MIAYKLIRQMKDGSLSPLFINKKSRMRQNKWMKAECFPTKGFAVRPGWHCTCRPEAPHLTEKDRVWVEVEIEDFKEHRRPLNQGGMWYLADKMKIIRILSDAAVRNIRNGQKPVKRKTMLLSKLPRFNNKLSELPMPVEHLGKRKQWTGIGWVTESEADGTEPLLILDDER